MESTTNIGPNWNGPICCGSSEADNSSVQTELGRFLTVLNCLPGTGYLKIIVDKVQVTEYDLPFVLNFVPLSIRKDLLLALTSGGGCEITLSIPEASHSLLFGVCFQSGKWGACPPQDVQTKLATNPQQVAASFPKPGAVEHRRLFKASVA
jgi:hypothetical protein